MHRGAECGLRHPVVVGQPQVASTDIGPSQDSEPAVLTLAATLDVLAVEVRVEMVQSIRRTATSAAVPALSCGPGCGTVPWAVGGSGAFYAGAVPSASPEPTAALAASARHASVPGAPTAPSPAPVGRWPQQTARPA
jgi:hypothetical protein